MAEVWSHETEEPQIWHRVTGENRYAVNTLCKKTFRKDQTTGEAPGIVDRTWDRPKTRRCKICYDLSGG